MRLTLHLSFLALLIPASALLTGCSPSTTDAADASAAPDNLCAAAGGSCMLVSGSSVCGAGHHVANRAWYPCAAEQTSDVECCLADGAEDAGVDAPPGFACAQNGAYAGQTGTCGVTSRGLGGSDPIVPIPCGPGCTCSTAGRDRWNANNYYCWCPPPPTPGQCTAVNCGSIFCDRTTGVTCADASTSYCH